MTMDDQGPPCSAAAITVTVTVMQQIAVNTSTAQRAEGDIFQNQTRMAGLADLFSGYIPGNTRQITLGFLPEFRKIRRTAQGWFLVFIHTGFTRLYLQIRVL